MNKKEMQMILDAFENLVSFWPHYASKIHMELVDIEAIKDAKKAIRALRQALAQPEPTVEDNSQQWKGMDGAVAWHLIDRHADNWADIGKMMDEWLKANQAQPEQEPVGYFSVNDYGNWEQNENGIGKPFYTAPPKREWVGLTDEERELATGWSVEHIESYLKEKNT